jgi:hypothetical protein
MKLKRRLHAFFEWEAAAAWSIAKVAGLLVVLLGALAALVFAIGMLTA